MPILDSSTAPIDLGLIARPILSIRNEKLSWQGRCGQGRSDLSGQRVARQRAATYGRWGCWLAAPQAATQGRRGFPPPLSPTACSAAGSIGARLGAQPRVAACRLSPFDPHHPVSNSSYRTIHRCMHRRPQGGLAVAHGGPAYHLPFGYALPHLHYRFAWRAEVLF